MELMHKGTQRTRWPLQQPDAAAASAAIRQGKLHRPLPPSLSALFFSCFKLMQLRRKPSEVLCDRRASWKGLLRVQSEVFSCRCTIHYHRHLAGVVCGNLGFRVCVLEGCGWTGRPQLSLRLRPSTFPTNSPPAES